LLPQSRVRLAYLLPILHLLACLASMAGHVVPKLQNWGIAWTFIMLADLPVSLLAYVFAFKGSLFSVIWILVVGTLWWYLLGLLAEALLDRFIRPPNEPFRA
jgi:hypothetical protein